MTLALIEEQADRAIRRLWHDGRLFFSVIDVIGLLTESSFPNRYWTDLKRKLITEGADQPYEKIVRLKMRSPDGKQRLTDAADTETLLRIIQSVPSPKAEPVKQWLARVGAQRLDTMTRPIDTTQAHAEGGTITRPAADAPLVDLLEYHERMVALLRRQLTQEAQLAEAQAQLDKHAERMDVQEERLDEHDAQLAVLHSWVGHLEAEQRLLPELLERLGPQTLTPAHQAKVKAFAVN